MNFFSLSTEYSAGIAPAISQKQYTALIDAYKRTGKFPPVLRIGGVAVDASENGNGWRIKKDDLKKVAKALKGVQIRKNHSDNVDDIIGRVIMRGQKMIKYFSRAK